MANMSYCRFENTAGDLRDCLDVFDDEPSSESERRARLKIIRMAVEIADDYGDEVRDAA